MSYTISPHLAPPTFLVSILVFRPCILPVSLDTLSAARFLKSAVSLSFLHRLFPHPAYDLPSLAIHTTLQVSASCRPHSEGTSCATLTKQRTHAKCSTLYTPFTAVCTADSLFGCRRDHKLHETGAMQSCSFRTNTRNVMSEQV